MPERMIQRSWLGQGVPLALIGSINISSSLDLGITNLLIICQGSSLYLLAGQVHVTAGTVGAISSFHILGPVYSLPYL